MPNLNIHNSSLLTLNGCPANLINRTIEQVRKDVEKEQQPEPPSNDLDTSEETQQTPTSVKIYLPYAGKQGELITKDINKTVSKIFNKKVTANVSFKSKKLSSFFSVKDKTKIKHKHNLVYKVTCPDCPATYIGEAGRRLQERVDDHGGRDKNSHVLKHSLERGHNTVKIENFSILGNNFYTETQRKVSEAFFIKSQMPTINIQRLSRPILLFK